MDETLMRIAGRWVYLFRAVDSNGQTVDFYLSEARDREAGKAVSETSASESRITGGRAFLRGMGCGAIRPRSANRKGRGICTVDAWLFGFLRGLRLLTPSNK